MDARSGARRCGRSSRSGAPTSPSSATSTRGAAWSASVRRSSSTPAPCATAGTSSSRTARRTSPRSCATSAARRRRSVAAPTLRVDHVSIAVHAIEPALALFRRVLPTRMNVEPRAGYDDQFVWTDFLVGDFKIELIQSARPRSFVERFIAGRGEGFHHLSIDVTDGDLDRWTAELEAEGLRIVDRGDFGDAKTAFISPRSTPGILVQFWQTGFHDGEPAGRRVVERDGVRFRVDHLSIAVRSIDTTLAWFQRFFPVELRRPKHRG